MRFFLCAALVLLPPAGLVTGSDRALAQMKLPSKAAPAPGGSEIRYFTSIDGLMSGNADVVLKETRQGKTVTAAVLDVCYPVEKGSIARAPSPTSASAARTSPARPKASATSCR